MKPKTIFLETTVIPAVRSIGEITGMLAEAGATSINQQFDNRRITGLSFSIQTAHGPAYFQIPARTAAVQKKLREQLGPRTRKTDAELAVTAERIAWRQLAVWCKAQLAIIDLGMVQTEEVFLPYLIGAAGRTVWEDFSRQKALPAPGGGR